MGQFSAELNYVRRLERYEEEWEERILKSENWREELERYLEEAMKEWEEQEEESENEINEANREYEDSSLMMMEGNLSEDEKREIKEHMEEEHQIVTSDGLVLLQRSGKGKKEEEEIEELETEDHLRELIEGIEALAEGSLQREEKLENLEEELSEEEKRQEELYREALFESIARKIEVEAESEDPLERLLEEAAESAESREIEERIEELSQKPVEYEKPEEYEEPAEELEIPEEKFKELMGEEESLEEVIESLEESEEVEEEKLEEGVKPVEERSEEPVKELAEEVEEVIEEKVEELVKEGVEGLVEGVAEKEAEEEEVSVEVVEETEAEEEVEEPVEELVEGTEELVEEVGEEEEVSKEVVRERAEELVEEEVREEEVLEEEEESPEESPDVVVVGEERPEKEFENITAGETIIWLQGEELDRGLYWVQAVRGDGKVFEWLTGIKRKAKSLSICKDLARKKIKKLKIYKYDKTKHFPKHFELLGHQLYFDPVANKLMIDGKEINIETVEWKLDPNKIDTRHGLCVTITTQLKSIKSHPSSKLRLRLFQDETIDLVSTSGKMRLIKYLEIEANLLMITYRCIKDRVIMYPLRFEELKNNVKYETSIEIKGKGKTHILHELRKKHGYDNVEKLRNDIGTGRAYLRIEFDNGDQTYCSNRELAVKIPQGAKKITSYTVIEARDTDGALLTLRERMRENVPDQVIADAVGRAGEYLIRDEKMEEIRKYVSNTLGIPEGELDFEDLKSKGPDWPVKHKGKVIAIIEAKSTIKPERFDSQMEAAKKKLINYYFSGEYKHGKYSDVKHGFAVVSYFDPYEALATGKGIKMFDIKYIPNPFVVNDEKTYI